MFGDTMKSESMGVSMSSSIVKAQSVAMELVPQATGVGSLLTQGSVELALSALGTSVSGWAQLWPIAIWTDPKKLPSSAVVTPSTPFISSSPSITGIPAEAFPVVSSSAPVMPPLPSISRKPSITSIPANVPSSAPVMLRSPSTSRSPFITARALSSVMGLARLSTMPAKAEFVPRKRLYWPVASPVVSSLMRAMPPLPLLPSAPLSNMLIPWGLVVSGDAIVAASVVE